MEIGNRKLVNPVHPGPDPAPVSKNFRKVPSMNATPDRELRGNIKENATEASADAFRRFWPAGQALEMACIPAFLAEGGEPAHGRLRCAGLP